GANPFFPCRFWAFVELESVKLELPNDRHIEPRMHSDKPEKIILKLGVEYGALQPWVLQLRQHGYSQRRRTANMNSPETSDCDVDVP
ncbi:10389_t:CDS:2, partial [Gigaspora rosea]